MKSAIINADDFGLSPGVNRGILDAFRDGILTSTTMLANMPAFDDAVAIARANPDVPVGVHLSLLWGPPVVDPSRVPTLVDRSGNFLRSAGRLAARCMLNRLSRAEVEAEFRSQIRRVIDAGLRPAHLDTHKHIHALPAIRRAVLTLAREFGIDRVRLPFERAPRPGARQPWKATVKRTLIRSLCRDARVSFSAAGVKTTDHFVGIGWRLDRDALSFILHHLDDGVTEIMCHPGYVDDEVKRWSANPRQREVEFAALKEPSIREYIDSGAVRLIHYGDL